MNQKDDYKYVKRTQKTRSMSFKLLVAGQYLFLFSRQSRQMPHSHLEFPYHTSA